MFIRACILEKKIRQEPWPEITQIEPSIHAGFLTISAWSVLTISTVMTSPMTTMIPPRTAVFFGDRYLSKIPGMIPNRENAFNMKSNQSKISS